MIKFFTALIFAIVFSVSATAAEIGDDGLHKQDWFTITFRDIAEDIAAAKDEGKRLVMIFEQRGCIYCREVHEILLVDPAVKEYLQEHFMIVQYNIHGDEEVTDTDGEALTEKTAARKWGFLFTPTIMFMPEEITGEKNAQQMAVATMPGFFRKGTFLDMFTWVNEKGYDGSETFQDFHARQIRERRAAGIVNTD